MNIFRIGLPGRQFTENRISNKKSHFDRNNPIDNPFFTKEGHTSTAWLLLTACKSFARKGDQKMGVAKHIKLISMTFERSEHVRVTTPAIQR